MSIYYDATISGSGSAALSAQRVNYAFLHLTAVGSQARPLEAGDPDHFLRIGWFAFGTDITVPSYPTYRYWRNPIWIDFIDTLWTPIPQTNYAAQDDAIYATHVRWSLAMGATGRLVVSGV